VLAVLLLLGQMAVAMVTTALQQTPTIDEPVYVAASVVYLQQHSLRYNPEHPPLGKLIMGAGLAFADVRLDPAFNRNQSVLGRHVLYQSGNDAFTLVLLARLPIIVLTLLFGLVVFAFARDLVGPVGGLVALALYAFSPDVIAHGSLATLDVPTAGFLFTSAWLLWRARRRPVLYLPLAALALGAALATKMSALPAVPILLLLAMIPMILRKSGDESRNRTWKPQDRRELMTLARRLGLGVLAAVGVAVVAVAVVWASYLAVDPRLQWVTPETVPAIRGKRGLLADLMPFPAPYGDGMRIQFAFERKQWNGFLFGRPYQGSLWYYLPSALLVKTPLGMLALWLAGSVTMVALPRLRAAVPYVLVPALVLLAAAMAGARDFGTRYAIFLPMFLSVAAACLVALRFRWARVGTAVLVAFVAISSLRTYPYYLPYANEAFGGPANTHRHLHDSNVDWGQDLGRLAYRLRERYPGEKVWLIYKGSGLPSYYGIRAHNPLRVPPEQVRGLLVVSDSRVARPSPALAALINSSEPIDTVGHSITIYRRP
jgi:Dolichyl-phosphate-mannose-protein mannosyltransferase